MYKYTISLDNESVGIVSDTDLMTLFNQWSELLHLKDVAVSLEGENEFVVEYSNSTDNYVYYSNKCAHVRIPLAKLQSGELLLYAALPFLEVLQQRRSVITVHAAAVEIRGKAVLLLGKVGAGKTSLIISLCQNHQAQLIGNDIVKIEMAEEKIMACTGSKYFFLREESIRRNIPSLLSLFPYSEKDSWTHKIYCTPSELGIIIGKGFVPITRSYLVHIDETMDKLHSVNADTMDTRLYLNENMSRYIRGTAIALFEEGRKFLGYVPSFDTPDFFSMRVRVTEQLISMSKIKYVAGNLKDTCQHIISGI
ncbi:MAG: hypothetical protein ACK4NC_06300 [Candidatus Gracilibacteria bacterium]